MVADAPPTVGLEYLNAELLRSIWIELRERAGAEAAKAPGGPAAYLRALNPFWHLLGRVTFHLAENKRNPERPFAFLATYTHRLSGQARVAHLPLAEALKTYAGAKDQPKLESLLEPVRRAAEHSGLARELLDSKALFAPQAWTHSPGVSLSQGSRRWSKRRESWCDCPIGGRFAGRRGRRCK